MCWPKAGAHLQGQCIFAGRIPNGLHRLFSPCSAAFARLRFGSFQTPTGSTGYLAKGGLDATITNQLVFQTPTGSTGYLATGKNQTENTDAIGFKPQRAPQAI